MASAVHAVLGRAPKIEVIEDNSIAVATAAPKAPSIDDEALRAKALADPAVQLYQQMFPDAQLRGVKDLSYLKSPQEDPQS